MELTSKEKEILRLLVDMQLKELRKDEVARDTPLNMFEAEKEYEEALINLRKKIA